MAKTTKKTITIDKEFFDLVLRAVDDLKKEVKSLNVKTTTLQKVAILREKVTEQENVLSKTQTNDVFVSNEIWSRPLNEVSQTEMIIVRKQLEELMRKYKIINLLLLNKIGTITYISMMTKC